VRLLASLVLVKLLVEPGADFSARLEFPHDDPPCGPGG
jgi:hypothetical protein